MSVVMGLNLDNKGKTKIGPMQATVTFRTKDSTLQVGPVKNPTIEIDSTEAQDVFKKVIEPFTHQLKELFKTHPNSAGLFENAYIGTDLELVICSCPKSGLVANIFWYVLSEEQQPLLLDWTKLDAMKPLKLEPSKINGRPIEEFVLQLRPE